MVRLAVSFCWMVMFIRAVSMVIAGGNTEDAVTAIVACISPASTSNFALITVTVLSGVNKMLYTSSSPGYKETGNVRLPSSFKDK